MAPTDPKVPLFEDADETVQAIHQGDIDAVVVMRTLEGPQVILLHGAEEPYRVLVERMSDGALTVGPDGVILYVNDRLCELTGYPSTSLVGIFEERQLGIAGGHWVPAQLGRISRPISTFSVLDRSPMMRLSGSGNWRIRVGMATI